LHSERGNFLLQSLLALTLVFMFIPFFANRLASRNIDAQLYSATHQVETAQTAAKLFIQENANSLPFAQTRIAGTEFSDKLEPYGLPLGFVPRTALGQDIALYVIKDENGVAAFLRLSGGRLNGLQRAELARRIGFFAAYDSTNSNGDIDVGVQLGETYSDIVRRNEQNYSMTGFLTDLDMGNFKLDNAANIFANRLASDTGEITTLTITGSESGRRERSKITQINTNKTVFQSSGGEAALSLTRGTLKADSVVGRTISKFGETGNLTAVDAAVDTFDMSVGRIGFTGPSKWNLGSDLVTSRISFSTERLDVSSFINVTRGQDVYIDYDTLSYSSSSGIDTDVINTSHITLRDQTSSSLSRGGDGAVILDIRPAGTSVLPDALVDGINNGAFAILANPTKDDATTIDCNSVIASLGGVYNQKSLAHYIICQYVFWQRLERRINIKQCLIEGGSDCK
jgi:hypothetical protein